MTVDSLIKGFWKVWETAACFRVLGETWGYGFHFGLRWTLGLGFRIQGLLPQP